jgi:hypothetical protein
MVTNIQIINILVDNSDVDYPGAIIKVWWRLNCIDDNEFISYQCTTDLIPVFDNNFIPYENITNEMLKDWIIQIEGTSYTVLKNFIEKSVQNQMNISLYNTENYIFLSR